MDIQKELLAYAQQVFNLLKLDHSERDIVNDSILLLKLNRNRILYENIVRRNNWEKLDYELNKQLIHLCGRVGIDPKDLETENTGDDTGKGDVTAEMNEKAAAIMDVVDKYPEEHPIILGLRADHDTLPDEIKLLHVKNKDLYPLMRKCHEQLKLMVDAKPCDRYPFVTELIKLDDILQANWKQYDEYVTGSAPILTADEKKTVTPGTMDSKKVSAARKYLSTNKAKLAEMLKLVSEDTETSVTADKAEKLRAGMCERLKELIDAGESVAENQLAELKEIGVSI